MAKSKSGMISSIKLTAHVFCGKHRNHRKIGSDRFKTIGRGNIISALYLRGKMGEGIKNESHTWSLDGTAIN